MTFPNSTIEQGSATGRPTPPDWTVRSVSTAAFSQPLSEPLRGLRRGGTARIQHVVRPEVSAEETLFDARVRLKVATSRYAMHLSESARKRLFEEFDFLLDVDGWDVEDALPDEASYQRFLKWMIYTGDLTWSSLGVDNEGNLLAAWVRDYGQMTANFSEKVIWSQRITADGDLQQSAGVFTLEHFARQASAFLEGY